MALDGLVLASVISELKAHILGGRVDKIYQTEKEDILMQIRNQGTAYKLLITANSSYPRLHLSALAKNSSDQPPMFCMLLRKHLAGGRIIDITQPDFERIAVISVESTNELGDQEVKKLVIEIMGRHSNIILMKENGLILDSIKHISLEKSSVREILPNRTYKRPPSQDKLSPLHLDREAFSEHLVSKQMPVFKGLYTSFNGISPLLAQDICLEAGVAINCDCTLLDPDSLDQLYKSFSKIFMAVQAGDFSPVLYYNDANIPDDFYALPLTILADRPVKHFESISALLEYFYHERSTHFNVAQKTADIKKLLHTFLERAVRKKEIQEKALEACSQKDLYRVYGELLTASAYQIPKGSDSFTAVNYYEEDCPQITISLDPHKTAIENAQSYFKYYNKAKRTESAAHTQLAAINEDIRYLQSVLVSLDFIETREDISELRSELTDMGYLKKRKGLKKKKSPKKELPFLHFRSSLGHDIYVGKNNYQNDLLTMKFARSNDMWLHIKDGPGSHVIIRASEMAPINDQVLLEGAMLAAYHSSGRMSSRVPIDYTLKKNVKKIAGAKPGMVIYTQFKTLFITPDEASVKRLSL